MPLHTTSYLAVAGLLIIVATVPDAEVSVVFTATAVAPDSLSTGA